MHHLPFPKPNTYPHHPLHSPCWIRYEIKTKHIPSRRSIRESSVHLRYLRILLMDHYCFRDGSLTCLAKSCTAFVISGLEMVTSHIRVLKYCWYVQPPVYSPNDVKPEWVDSFLLLNLSMGLQMTAAWTISSFYPRKVRKRAQCTSRENSG